MARCAPAVYTATQGPSATQYPYPPRVLIFDEYVVKFNREDLLNEADTQAFVYEGLKGSPGAPRVPEVYGCFTWERMQYFVMERIRLPTVETWIKDATSEAESQSRFRTACQAVADALRWLFALPLPADTEIGLIDGPYAQTQSAQVREGSGCVRHPFFGLDNAPFRYAGPLALQRHVNEVCQVPVRHLDNKLQN